MVSELGWWIALEGWRKNGQHEYYLIKIIRNYIKYLQNYKYIYGSLLREDLICIRFSLLDQIKIRGNAQLHSFIYLIMKIITLF